MSAFYGLRRSEVLGIKWDAIDFERNTITIRHTVIEAKKDGKRILVAKDSAKTKSSLRSLPLVAGFKEKLLQLKKQQKWRSLPVITAIPSAGGSSPESCRH